MSQLTREEKASLFRDQANEFLTQDEGTKVKIALATFMKTKTLEPLVASLNSVLNTPTKGKLFSTIGLFIPSKFLPDYKKMTGLAAEEEAAAAAATAPAAAAAAATTTTASAPAGPADLDKSMDLDKMIDEGKEEREKAAAAQAKKDDLAAKMKRLADARAEAEAAKAKDQDEGERAKKAAAAIAEAESQAALRKKAAEAEAAAAAAAEAEGKAKAKAEADAALARTKEVAAEAEAAAAAAAAAEAESAAAESAAAGAAAETAATPEPAAAPAAAEEGSAAVPAAAAAAAAADSGTGGDGGEDGGAADDAEAAPELSPEELAQQKRDEENKRSQARREARKKRLAAAEAAEAELNAAKPKFEETERVFTRTGTVVGRVGGVKGGRAKWMAFAEESKETKSSPTTKRRGMPGMSAVQRARQSYLEGADRASRDFTRVDRLIKAETDHGEKHGGKFVFYTTTVTGIAMTKIHCTHILNIFQRLRVGFEVRNIYMSKEIHEEFQERLPGKTVPQVCFNGEYLGGYDAVFKMNETGELQELAKHMKKIEVGKQSDCQDCGGSGFVVCTWCGGDRKSMAVEIGDTGHVDREQAGTEVKLKCTACNENGLQACQSCMMTDC